MEKDDSIRLAKRLYMREYMRNYRQRNKERIKKNTDSYWSRQALVYQENSVELFEAELDELRNRRVLSNVR